VAYAACGIVRLIPVEAASNIGGWLGRTIGPRLGVTGRARRNLIKAFPEKSAADIDRIVHGMWENLGRTTFEYPNVGRIRFSGDDPHVEVINEHIVHKLKEDGRPGIIVSGHLANWELIGPSVNHHGLPLHLVYRAPNNPAMERIFGIRQTGEAKLFPKGAQGARGIITAMNRGEHIGLLVDQKMNDGIPVKFFGRDAMTAPALAQFGIKFHCPIVPARIERLGGMRFRLTLHGPIEFEETGDRHADIANAMTRVTAIIEDWIRERPEQWLWLHNRWPD